MRKCIIILFGATGVGKTDFGDTLASHFPAEIVNADLGQFYTPLSIGTAKPDWRKSPVAQHLFDIINEPRIITVSQYRDQVTRTLEGVWQRNAIPIIVGGSGFYLRSLFFPPTSALSKSEVKKPLLLQKDLWKHLYSIDPERALHIHPHDLYRINRALDIYYETGTKPSEHVPRYQGLGSFCFVSLDRERSDLYDRINQRTEIMLNQGWVEEVERLRNTQWESFLTKKKLIGYDDILEYLEADKIKSNRQELIEIITRKTRHYAKRQITFGNQLFAHLEKALFETVDTRSSCIRFNLTSGTIELYINQLLGTISSMQCFEKDRQEKC